MNNRWIISDTHFYHAKMILYENRPFEVVEEMNATIIKNWNNTVSKREKIFVLGDFSFGNKEQISEIVEKLNGWKILICGNHDNSHSIKWWMEIGFNEVSKYPIIVDKYFILSHEPLYINDSMPYVNIHGHTHSKSMDSEQYFNVSVEKLNYTPANLDLIENDCIKI